MCEGYEAEQPYAAADRMPSFVRAPSRSSGMTMDIVRTFESAKEKTPRLRSLCFPACVLLFLLSSCRCCVLVSTLPTAAVRSLTLEPRRSENARIVVSVPFISSYARSHVHLSSFAFQVQLFLRHALVQAVFRRRVALARREQSGHAEFQIPSVFGGVTWPCSCSVNGESIVHTMLRHE